MTPNDRDPWSWGWDWPDWLGELGGLELGANPRDKILSGQHGRYVPTVAPRPLEYPPVPYYASSCENAFKRKCFDRFAMIPNTVNTHGIRPTGHKKR